MAPPTVRPPPTITLSLDGLYLNPASTLTVSIPVDAEFATKGMKNSWSVRVSTVSINVAIPALVAFVANPATVAKPDCFAKVEKPAILANVAAPETVENPD